MAGNGGRMAIAEKDAKMEIATSTTTRRKRRKKEGAAARKTGSRAGGEGGIIVGAILGAVEGKKKRATTKRDGAGRLRRALDTKMAEHTKELAKVLTDKALHGDVATARLMVALVEGGKPKVEKKKKRHGPTLAERWRDSPEWKGPFEPDEKEGKRDEPTLDEPWRNSPEWVGPIEPDEKEPWKADEEVDNESGQIALGQSF